MNSHKAVSSVFQRAGSSGSACCSRTLPGPEAITGGAFGPQASLIVLPFMLLMAVVIYFYTRGRVRSGSPAWPARQVRLPLRRGQVRDEGPA
jgi:hypothetical protein